MDHTQIPTLDQETSTPINKTSNEGENVENTILYLPVTKDGVSWLGDLWDCRSTETVGQLYKKSFEKRHLRASPIQNLVYDLTRSKNAEDFISSMFISVSLGIEAMGGKVKFKGKARFDRDERQEYHKERIICNYDLTSFEVALRPNALNDEQILDGALMREIRAGSTRATHFVDALVLGGQAQATIEYYKNVDFSNFNLFGALEGTLEMGPVKAEAKASFELLDKEYKEEYSTHISIHAQPSIPSSPVDCETMFKAIEGLDDVIQAENHFPQLNDYDIYGVPLRFRLVPIKRLVSLEEEDGPPADGTYKVLDPTLLSAYASMICTLDDYSFEPFVKQLLARRVPNLNPILQDPYHPWTLKVGDMASLLTEKAVALKRQALELFEDYKFGESTSNELKDLVEVTFPTLFPSVEDQLLQLEEQGRRELIGFRATDIDHVVDDAGFPAVSFLTNETSLTEWYGEDKVTKVLLYTNSVAQDALLDQGVSIGSIFLKLFQIAPLVKPKGVEVGIALPSISSEFCLLLKTDGVETKYSSHEDMDFVIDLLRCITLTGPPAALETFVYVICELSSIVGTSTLFSDVPRLFRILRLNLPGNAHILETYCATLAFLEESQGGTWNILVPLDAKHRVLDSIRAYREQRYSPTLQTVAYNWVFGCLEISSQESAPLFFIFQGSTLRYICYDTWDFALFLRSLEDNEEAASLISYEEAMVNPLYGNQWNYAAYAIPSWVEDHRGHLSQVLPEDDPEDPLMRTRLPKALSILRALSTREDLPVLNTLCDLALKEIPLRAEPILLNRLGWEGGRVNPAKVQEALWDSLVTELSNMARESSPLMTEVIATLATLRAVKPPEPGEVEDPEGEIEDPEGPLSILDDDEEEEEDSEGEIEDPDEGDLDENERLHRIMSKILYLFFYSKSQKDREVLAPLKARVDLYSQEDEPTWGGRQTKIVAAFEAFLEDNPAVKEFFNVGQLIAFASHKAGLEKEEKGVVRQEFLVGLAKAYVSHPLAGNKYRAIRDQLLEMVDNEQYYTVLSNLDQLSVHPSLQFLHGELSKQSWFPESDLVINILNGMQRFKLDQLRNVWSSRKFIFLLRSCLENAAVLASIYQLITALHGGGGDEDEGYVGESDGILPIPDFIPEDIEEKVKPFLERKIRPSPSFSWLHLQVDTLSWLVEAFKSFVSNGRLPPEFTVEFGVMLVRSPTLEAELNSGGILYYWDPDLKLFVHPWTLDTVSAALNMVTEATKAFSASSTSYALSNSQRKPGSEGAEVILNEEWRPFVEAGTMDQLTISNFFEMTKDSETSRPSHLAYETKAKLASLLFPFWVTKMKQGTFTLVKPEEAQGCLTIGNPFISTEGVLTLLTNLSEDNVIHRLLQRLTDEGVLPLPLVVVDARDGNQGLYVNLVDVLKKMFLPNVYQDSFLFGVPYRFVLTLRVGATFPNIGRSSVLNSLLTGPSFASLSNDAHKGGKSLGRNGYLEILPLAESTCDSLILWPRLEDFRGQIILGTWHGDALDDLGGEYLRNTVSSMVSAVVVFWKVSNWKELRDKREALEERLGHDVKHIRHVVLYPDHPTLAAHVPHDTTLLDMTEASEVTKRKLAGVLGHAFIPMVPMKSVAPRQEADDALIEFIQKESIQKIKKALKAKDHPLAQETLRLFDQVVAMDHPGESIYRLSVGLDMMSQSETLVLREHLNRCRVDLQGTYAIRDTLTASQLASRTGTLVNEIKPHLQGLESHILTLQDLIDHTGLYLKEHRPPSNVASYCTKIAEIWGDTSLPVDLESCLNPSFLPLWNDIISSTPGIDKRVFVLAIVGEKGSGKSALLHKLFGSYIPLKEWGCTKGIQARLIWNKEEDGIRRNGMDADVLLVLDCEGWGPPENWGDGVSRRKERNLATFLMQTCNLVIVNTLGGGALKEPLRETIEVSLLSSLLTQGAAPPRLLFVRQMLKGHKESTFGFQSSFSHLQGLSRAHGLQIGCTEVDYLQLSRIHKAIMSDRMVATVAPIGNPTGHMSSIAAFMTRINSAVRDSKSTVGRQSIAEWSDMATPIWNKSMNETYPTTFRGFEEAEATVGQAGREGQTKAGIMEALLGHEKSLFPSFKKAVDEALAEGNPDAKLDWALAQIKESLLNAINVCDLEKHEEALKGLLTKTADSSSGGCSTCKDALSMKEEFLQSVQARALSKTGYAQDVEGRVELSNWEQRYQVYIRFVCYTLSRQIIEGKSERLAALVSTLLEETGGDGEAVFTQLCRYLSSQTSLPNSKEQLYFELSSIYEHLQGEIVTHLQYPFTKPGELENRTSFEGKDVFILEPFFTAGATRVPLYGNQLNKRMVKWFRMQLEKISSDLAPTSLSGLYYQGIGLKVKEMVERALGLLKAELKAFEDAQYTLEFQWGAHVYACNHCLDALKTRQAEWMVGRDPILVLQERKEAFLEDPGNFFRKSKNPNKSDNVY